MGEADEWWALKVSVPLCQLREWSPGLDGHKGMEKIDRLPVVQAIRRLLWRPMSRLYTFNINGAVHVMSLAEAMQRAEPEFKKRVEEIKLNLKSKKMVHDGFTPGFQENIGTYCGDRKQYDNALKERGLIEVGKDHVPQDSTTIGGYFKNDEVIQEIINDGVELTGNEIEALKSGEYFKE